MKKMQRKTKHKNIEKEKKREINVKIVFVYLLISFDFLIFINYLLNIFDRPCLHWMTK